MTRWRSNGCAVAVAVLVLGSCSETTPSADAPSPVSPPAASSALTRAIVELTNAERTRAGGAALREDGVLARAAQIQADQLVAAGRLAHDLPGAMYPTLQDRLAAVGYAWRAAGENLASGQLDAAAVVAGWMGSQGHRDNILNPAFSALGVAYAADSSGRRYYVQVFAAPR